MKFLSLFLILFSLNGYAAYEPCLTPDCAAFQSAIEAAQRLIEARQKFYRAKNKIITAEWIKEESRQREFSFKIEQLVTEARQEFREAERAVITAEKMAIEARQWVRELKQSQSSN